MRVGGWVGGGKGLQPMRRVCCVVFADKGPPGHLNRSPSHSLKQAHLAEALAREREDDGRAGGARGRDDLAHRVVEAALGLGLRVEGGGDLSRVRRRGREA